MTIVQTFKSDRNITTGRNTNLAEKLDYPDNIPYTVTMHSGTSAALQPVSIKPHRQNIDYAQHLRLESEAFYTPDTALAYYAPGSMNITDEITRAIRAGNGITDETGEVSSRLYNINYFNPGYSSPLNFEQKLKNLRTLRNTAGYAANNYVNEFNAALDEITDSLLLNGGVYINADAGGIAGSIRSFYNGQDGKYSIDDIKAMIVLSRQRLIDDYITDPNELVLGVLLGYEACSIMALRKNGKLTDNAVETIWNEFLSFTARAINMASDSINAARQDPLRNKKHSYSQIDGNLINNAISTMLSALDNNSFNAGIRNSLKELDSEYKKHILDGCGNGYAEHRYSPGSLLRHFAGPATDSTGKINAEWSIRSSHFAAYFNIGQFALRGNIFGSTL